MHSTATDALAALEDALDAVAAVDLHEQSDGALLARTKRLVSAQNRLAAQAARTVRAAENRQAAEHDGLKTMSSWLRAHCRLSGGAATRMARQGRALEWLPAVEAAYAAGEVNADQVDVIATIATPDNLDRAAAQGIDLPEIESAAVRVATTLPYDKLRTVVGTYLARLDPDGREPDPTEERSLVLLQHPDGAWTGGLALDPVGGTKVATTLEAISTAGRCAGDTRSRAQRHADALVQLCDLALASGQLPILRTVKPPVLVTISDRDLTDTHPGHGAATTATGAALSAARARWIGCDSAVTRVLLGPDSAPLDHGRTHRLVTSAQRRALEIRDRGCVFAGCSAPTWWCEAHHLLEWALGGPTDLNNLALLCERHHAKADHGFRVERQPDGRWRTWRPDGTEILTAPASSGQVEPQDDLALRVTLSGRDEAQPGVEAGRASLAGHVAREQLGGAVAAHQLGDLPHDLPAVTPVLIAVVDEQLPEEPGTVEIRGLRLHVPAQHHEADR